ncbi:MAG: D-alanyl-D-alanine carboxypeptidase family protein [Clostridia bacterium]|nr:D-alanyl-D-alanine carboxypeptidase family protein [Clostridia bacterium]
MIFNGKQLSVSTNTISVDEAEMVPLNTMAYLTGINTRINPKEKTVVLKNNKIDLEIEIGSSHMIVNGEDVDTGIAIPLINNIVYIPADFVEIASGGTVTWDGKSKRMASVIDPDLYLPDSASDNTASKTQKLSINISKSAFIGNLVLVNKSNPVSDKFIPDGLISALDKNKKYLIPCKTSSVKLKKEAMDAAVNMFKAANNAKLKNLIVSNGYRSYGLQSSYYNKKINAYKKIYTAKQAVEKASLIVAPPGKSEHQTGLAIDVTTKKMLKSKQGLTQGFSSTPEGKWVNQNSWKYGYIVRYQADKTKITGIISEPWHLRYVGLPHSEIMNKKKMCLEEYLEYIAKSGHISFKTVSGSEYEIFYINVPAYIETLSLIYTAKEKYDVSSYGKSGFIITKAVKK